MNLYRVTFEYLLDEQNDVWELPIEATSEEDAKARIQRNRAPMVVKAVTPVDYVSYGPCSLCGRDTDSTSVNVAALGVVCGICWEKADEGVDVPLDNTEDEPEGLREGQPEFNGAFGG